MTKFAVVALVLINAAFATQVFLGNTNKMTTGAFAQLKAIEGTEFGKNLLDTIAIQIQNQAPLSDVAKLLGELKADLIHQQNEDDELHTRREEDCAQSIAEYDRRILVASEEIRQATERIGQITNRIAELEVSIADYEHQIAEAEKSVADAISDRARRAGQFDSRVAQHQGVIEALDLILTKLAEYGNNNLPEETALLQLAKIGNGNPIAAFVQVAASLSPESWKNINEKLTALRDATQASLNEDAEQERLEIENHNNFLSSMATLLESLRNSLGLDQQELGEQRADLADQEIRLDTNTIELQNATEGKSAKETQCENWRVQWRADSEHRYAEIHIIEQVQEIFAQRLETAQDYLKQRIEQ
jgi:chromosome segregation ATPase